MQRVLTILSVAAIAVVLSACGGTEESEDAAVTTVSVTTTEPEATTEPDETTISDEPELPPVDEPVVDEEVEVVECAQLEGPVNLAVQSVGCTVDGAQAPVSALPCEDGRTVLIAGNRFGIEGETWQPYDLATGPPATELC